MTLEEMRRWGLVCEDPECTATHVVMETLTPIAFTEESP